MKLKALAGAVALATLGLAQAQTANVTLYGRLDVAVENVRISGATSGAGGRSISAVTNDGSRWGMRGREDLGGGTYATFVLENGFAPDTGTATQGGLLFGRHLFVGVGNAAAGEVRLGRNYAPMDEEAYLFDPFFFGSNSAQYLEVKYQARVDNSIKYLTPRMGGVQGSVLFGLHEKASGAAKVGDFVGADVNYAAGPLAFKLSGQQVKVAGALPNTAVTRKDYYLGARFNADVVIPSVVYFERREPGTSKYRVFSGGAQIPLGAGRAIVKYSDVRQGVAKSASLGVGYWYALSKRTAAYGTYTLNRNGSSSNLLTVAPSFLPNIALGEDIRGLQFGMRHNF